MPVVKIKRIRTNFQVRFGYDEELIKHLKTISKEQIKTAFDTVITDSGQSKKDWFHICNIHGLMKIMWYCQDNHILYQYENLSEKEIWKVEEYVKKRKERLIQVEKFKNGDFDEEIKNEDYSFMKIEPYLYQKKAVKFFECSDGVALLGDEPGVGKTLTAISYSAKHHFQTLIICPASLALIWAKEILKFTHEVPYVFKYKIKKKEGLQLGSPETSKIHIVSYNALETYLKFDVHHKCQNPYCDFDEVSQVKKHKMCPKCFKENSVKSRNTELCSFVDKGGVDLKTSIYDLVVIDECFVYETNIMTEFGNVPIGDLVEFNLDFKVLSYNHITKKNEYKKINRYIKKQTSSCLLKIRTNNGQDIVCTPNHKIYINGNKYVRAEEIKTGDTVWVLSKTAEQKANMEKGKILQCELRLKNNYEHPEIKIGSKETKFKAFDSKIMSMVWKNIQNKIKRKTISKKKILFNELFCKMENVPTGNKGKDIYGRNQAKSKRVKFKKLSEQPCKSPKIFNSNEIEQPYGGSKKHRKNEKEFSWKNIFIKRWQWTNNKTATKVIRFFGRRMGNGISNKNKASEGIFQKFAKSLQSGFGISRIEIINRGRWKNASNEKMEIFGQEENGNIEFSRVESIEILESGNRQFNRSGCVGNKEVFNLEISDNHNYYANNILVSNCHYIKNVKSSRYKLVNAGFKKTPRKILMSGTAIKNKPYEFFPVLNFLDPFEWVNSHSFGVKYCGGKEDEWGHWNYDDSTNEAELFQKLSYLYLRRRKKDPGVLEYLPAKTYTIIPIYLTPEELREYKKLEKGVVEDTSEDDDRMVGLAKIQKLKMFTSKICAQRSFEFIRNIIDGDEKVVVFSQYVETTRMIYEEFKDNAVWYTGKKSAEEKEEAREKFMEDEKKKVFSGTIGAAGVGLTLTSASTVLFIDQPWTPSDRIQAEDRCHRAGQESDNVQIIRLVVQDTIDEYIEELLNKKEKITMQILDGEHRENSVKHSVFDDLLQIVLSKKKSL